MIERIIFNALGIYIMGFAVLFFIGHDTEALARSIFDAAIWPFRVVLGAWDLVDDLREGWPGWEGEVKRAKMKASRKEPKP
jgi:hypothetical protein